MSDHGRHRRADLPTRLRGVLLVAGGALALIVVAASIGWLPTTRDDTGAVASTALPAIEPKAADWIRSNLPADARLLTDGQTAPNDYSAQRLGESAQAWDTFDYLLTSSDLNPPADAPVTPVWHSSLPVAVFSAVQVRRILSGGPAEMLRTREADRADRLTAGRALLENPRVMSSPQAQAVLVQGGLDLRAAATLTALAGALNVYLAEIDVVAAEAAADMPSRAMAVEVSDAVKAQLVLGGLTAPFRPDRVDTTTANGLRLHWPLNFAPLPSVN